MLLTKKVKNKRKRKKIPFDISDRKYFLFFIDLCLILASTSWYCTKFYPTNSIFDLFYAHPSWIISMITIWIFIAYVVDLYNLELISDVYGSLKNTFIAAYLSVFTYIFLPYLTPVLPNARINVYIFIFLFIISLLLWRYIYSRLFNNEFFLKRILVVSNGWSENSLVNVFAIDNIIKNHFGYQIIGFVDTEVASNISYRGIKIIRSVSELPKLVRRLQIDEILVDINTFGNIESDLFQKLTECRMRGVAVTSITDFYELLTGRIPIQHVGNNFYLAFPYNINSYKKIYLIFSKVIDLTFGILGCLLCALIIPIVFVINFFGNKGPLFYRQERVGIYGKYFSLTKFRSMIVDAEKMGAVWAQENDSRITPIGKILRMTRIDELPQCWNLLKGDMSLIGPRPERPVFVEQLKQEIPFYDTRHFIKPGLTGWAQVLFKYGSDSYDALVKLQYDLFYIKNRSIFLDLKIILKTISVVIRFKGQ